ncbi:MAG TPA: HEAT repeat domain-containing protein [Planctomycetota bacterium]|nr:HEAT repeat domain-containing protein [Planctomycetota bacterium]
MTGDDPGSWRVWWTLNHDRFIDVAAHAPIAVSDSGHSVERSVARADAYERLIPIVTRVVEQEENEILLGRALIALAKLGENPRIANSREVYKQILPFVANEKTRIAESAAVALGILGHDDAVMTLSKYASAPQGKTGNGIADGARSDRVRAFALYGLGLVARDAKREDVRRVAASRLCAIFTAEQGMAVDVKVACLQALSLVPLGPDAEAALNDGNLEVPTASRDTEVEWVLRVLDSTSEATWVRAQAATTAARLCGNQPEGSKLRARIADRLVETLMNGSHDGLPIRQSAALALGQVGDSDDDASDVEIRDALTAAMMSDSDQATRYFAMMALAQAASRPGGPAAHTERLAAADATRALLLRRATQGSETDRAWAAISIGVFEYRMRQAGQTTSPDSAVALRSMLEDTHSPEVAGASCLALGLAGVTGAKDELMAQLTSPDSLVRGFAALSLGMLGVREAAPALERVLDKADGAPDVYVPVSEGLAMLGAPVTERLIKALVGGGASLEAQLAACVAIGRTGGARAVRPLSDLVDDSTGTTWVRAVAVEALGSIGDHGATRWNARYAFDLNFLALPLTGTAPTFDGVLDLE